MGHRRAGIRGAAALEKTAECSLARRLCATTVSLAASASRAGKSRAARRPVVPRGDYGLFDSLVGWSRKHRRRWLDAVRITRTEVATPSRSARLPASPRVGALTRRLRSTPLPRDLLLAQLDGRHLAEGGNGRIEIGHRAA